MSASTVKYVIMKMTFLFVVAGLTGLQALLASPGKAQNPGEIRVIFELKGESLKTAFSKIEKVADVRFAYNRRQVEVYKNITLARDSYSLEKLLELLLSNTTLSYRQVNNKIIIFRPEISAAANAPAGDASAAYDGGIRG